MSSISSILSSDNAPSSIPPTETTAVTKDQQQAQVEEDVSTTSKELDAQHQRKRSKVSRACDECRRKKIKCDATFKAHSKTLEKACSSCSKNGYICSFDRVPLKRGPTKGYVKSDQANTLNKNGDRYTNIQPQPQSQPQPQPQPQPQVPSITLPPLTSITSFQQGQPPQSVPQQRQSSQVSQVSQVSQISQPSSPGRSSLKRDAPAPSDSVSPNGSIPQSQFWKVPYEAPFDRRGSVDSISSSISDVRFSGGRNPASFSFQNARFGDSVISDSDDERSNLSPRASIDIRNRSRSNSGSLITAQNLPPGIPTSPALSISSLKSLNQGISKNLTINQSPSSFQFYAPEHSNLFGPSVGQPIQPQINTNYLVDSYYRFVHPNFPILPLNNQTLINILSNPPPLPSPQQNEVDELSHFIIQSFCSSLDLLISVLSRQKSPTTSPSLVGNQLSQFTETLYLSFYKLNKLFVRAADGFDKFPQPIVILFLSNLAILSYVVILLGDRNDIVVISSSIQILNRVKVYKVFWDDNNNNNNNNNSNSGPKNFDDFNYSLKRLWYAMHVLNALHSLSHGLPYTSSLELAAEEIDKLFPFFQGVEAMRDGFKLGCLLLEICKHRDFTNNERNSKILNHFKKAGITSTENPLLKPEISTVSLPYNFSQQIYTRLDIVSFLEEVKQSFSHNENFDEELVYDYQLKLSRLIRRQLTAQNLVFQSLKNSSNSIDFSNPSLLVSPFVPIIFKQSIKTLNVLKILINSLQLNESLVGRLSKLLNELIGLTNALSQIKPFLNNELNNHLIFKLDSENLEFWENDDNLKSGSIKEFQFIQMKWVGLMLDVLKYFKKEDYEGWF